MKTRLHLHAKVIIQYRSSVCLTHHGASVFCLSSTTICCNREAFRESTQDRHICFCSCCRCGDAAMRGCPGRVGGPDCQCCRCMHIATGIQQLLDSSDNFPSCCQLHGQILIPRRLSIGDDVAHSCVPSYTHIWLCCQAASQPQYRVHSVQMRTLGGGDFACTN